MFFYKHGVYKHNYVGSVLLKKDKHMVGMFMSAKVCYCLWNKIRIFGQFYKESSTIWAYLEILTKHIHLIFKKKYIYAYKKTCTMQTCGTSFVQVLYCLFFLQFLL